MIDTSFLQHLDRLSLIINKRITSNYVGERTTAYVGKGLIFKDHQIYAPGDDFRSIDWKVFGRTDKLFIKRYEEERNLAVHIIVDFSGSMAFGSSRKTKRDYASQIGLGFAYMALKNNERFVLSTFAEKLELFKARKGKSQLMSILDYLNKKKCKGKTNLEVSLGTYKRLINSKSYIVIVSDFLYDVNQIRNALYRIKNHKIVLVQVLDKIETDLNIEGDFKLVDTETKESLRTFVSPYARKQYIQHMADHKADIVKVCAEVGAQFYSFGTDVPVFDAFYDILG